MLSQTVTPTVQVGDTYTLQVYLGDRNDIPASIAGTADLLVNGNEYGATGSAPPVGGWSLFTAT